MIWNGIEFRQSPRFQVLEYAQVRRDGDFEAFSAVITDVSLTGIQVRTRVQLSQGEVVDIAIGRGDRVVHVRGEVRYATEVSESQLYAAGLRVTSLGADQRSAWVNYVHERFCQYTSHLADAAE